MSAYIKRESCATIGFWQVHEALSTRTTSFKIFQDHCFSVLEFFGTQSSTLFQVMKFFNLLQYLRPCNCCSLRQRYEDYYREVKSTPPTPSPLVYAQPLFGKRARNPSPRKPVAKERWKSSPIIILIFKNWDYQKNFRLRSTSSYFKKTVEREANSKMRDKNKYFS